MAAQEDPDRLAERLAEHDGYDDTNNAFTVGEVRRLHARLAEMETIAHGFEGQDTLLLTQHDRLKQDYTAALAEKASLTQENAQFDAKTAAIIKSVMEEPPEIRERIFDEVRERFNVLNPEPEDRTRAILGEPSILEELRAENAQLKAALERTRDYITKAMCSGGVKAICSEGYFDRAQRAGLKHALNAINAEFAKVEPIT